MDIPAVKTAPLALKEPSNENVFLSEESDLKLITLNLRGVIFQIEARTFARFSDECGFGCLLNDRYLFLSFFFHL